jgi:hypothetical protein
LIDTLYVPKLWSQQLLSFGRSGDGLGVLTFGVEQFSVLFVRDGPRVQCSSLVLRVLARHFFRSSVALTFRWAKFRTVRVYRADGPRVPGGQSVCSPWTVRYSGSSLEVLFAFSDGPWCVCGQSVWPVRTVRPIWPDGPPEPEWSTLSGAVRRTSMARVTTSGRLV